MRLVFALTLPCQRKSRPLLLNHRLSDQEGNAEASDDADEEEEESRRSNGQSRNRQWIDDSAKRKKAMKIKIKAQYEELNSEAFVTKCPEGGMPNTITKDIGTLEKEPALELGKTQKDHWDEGEMECLCRFWFGHMKDTTEAN